MDMRIFIMEESQWYYTTILKTEENSEGTRGREKGPIPQIVLFRLLEKGIIGSGENVTLVWKVGMDSWLPIQTVINFFDMRFCHVNFLPITLQVSPFKEIVEFQNKQWFYIDNDGNQKGPIYSRNLLHKLKECGEIDGMSLVFSCAGDMTEWKPISDIPELKNEVIKMALEEQAFEASIQLSENNTEMQKLLVFDSNGDAVEKLKEKVVVVENQAERKSFTADNGIRYYWDDKEQDWVEADENDILEFGQAESKGNKRELDDGSDSDSDEENDRQDSDRKGKESKDAKVDPADNSGDAEKAKKRKNRKKKKRKGPNNWIYVTGLPKDITFEEIRDHFSKVGLIEISPYDQQPKIRIYRESDEASDCKGDCSLCYNSEESMKLAIDILNGGFIRPAFQIQVTRADFSAIAAQGQGSGGRRPALSQAQVKVARTAMKQALAWNEDDDSGVNKAAALRIIVLEGMFSPSDFEQEDDTFERELQEDIATECGKCGVVEKITVFSQNVRGIVVVKFTTTFAAQECIKLMHGRFFGGRKIKCFFWDGVTNYTVTANSLGGKNAKKKKKSEEVVRGAADGAGSADKVGIVAVAGGEGPFIVSSHCRFYSRHSYY